MWQCVSCMQNECLAVGLPTCPSLPHTDLAGACIGRYCKDTSTQSIVPRVGWRRGVDGPEVETHHHPAGLRVALTLQGTPAG